MNKDSVPGRVVYVYSAKHEFNLLALKAPITTAADNKFWDIFPNLKKKLEDLKVLRRSPDLLNNVKIGQGQLQLIMEIFFVFTIYILVK